MLSKRFLKLGAMTASLVSSFQCWTTLAIKNVVLMPDLNFPWHSMKWRIVHLKSLTRVSNFNACSTLVLPIDRTWETCLHLPFLAPYLVSTWCAGVPLSPPEVYFSTPCFVLKERYHSLHVWAKCSPIRGNKRELSFPCCLRGAFSRQTSRSEAIRSPPQQVLP